MKTHHLFISHSWTYEDQYKNLINLLNSRIYFRFSDYSVPRNDPIHSANTDIQLRQAIRNQMSYCSVVLILAGVYATYSRWINIEIDLAKSSFYPPKPIIAIEPWGSEKTSVPVKRAADRIVRWNTESIIEAIRNLA